MSLTQYHYTDSINGLFELPTENARRLLPGHLEPAELHHGSSLLGITVFEFNKSEVGSYREVVMSVVVVPFIKGPGVAFPKYALYPFIVGTTTEASRRHAIERWHLPHWMEDVGIDIARQEKGVKAVVAASGAPVAELYVTEYSWSPIKHMYQCFMKDAGGAYMAEIRMDSEISEHQEELGRLRLYDHPFSAGLVIADVSDVAFTEIWMRNGVQTFEPLVQMQLA